jgi:hypothetical protein
MDMRKDLFAQYPFGQIALTKIGSADPNFRLFCAGWMGNGNRREVMQIQGAVFRESTRGTTKGQLSIMVPGTRQSAFVTAAEMAAHEATAKSDKQRKRKTRARAR